MGSLFFIDIFLSDRILRQLSRDLILGPPYGILMRL